TATTFTVGGGTSGTLNVGTTTVTDAGVFNMAAGATFQTTINGAANDQSGKIVVSGAAIVPITATIDINTGAVTLVAGTTYKIIDGDGSAGVIVPTTITDNNASFNFVGSVVTGDLVLTVQAAAPPTPVPPGTTGLSSNARAVQGAVNAFITSDPALAAALGGLVTSAELNAALESLIPDMSGTAQNATFGAHDISIRTVENRLLSLRMAGGGMMTGMAAGDPYSQRETAMWLQAFGSTIDQDNRQGISGFDADTVGTALGADTLLTENLRIGGAFSYGSTDVDTKGSQNRTDISSYQGVFYASYQRGDYYFDGIASYSLNNYDGSRNVVVGPVNRTAVADYDADQYGIKGSVGRTLQYRNFGLLPYASLLYVRLDTDGYTETGAGAANLTVSPETTAVLQSTVGVSISKEMATRKGTRFIPEAHIAWLHEFLNEGQVNTSTFTGGGGSFTTEGFDPADNSLNIGASVDIYKTEHLDFRAAYDFEVKEDFTGHSGQLILRYTFN
ncbi:MAG: autotransporter outer membrane beta-barrel domain-containing protein, partial [Gammaproteobacteria bacterium]|nr:autotransporter outer membrane beta-barrel domain-containing protein [Gammaproteobacteria bacterium]